jgi:PTS system galactosamine-specific IIB component
MGLALYISIKIKEELNMPNILMTRIDNRLVHGQVGVTWTTSLGANLLVVVDDTAASDTVQQQLMSMTAESSGVGIRFFTIQKTIDVIHKASPNQKIFIVCKTPEVVRKLVDGGVPIKELNVGNMHFSDGKRAITKKVYVDDKDIEELKYIESKGVKLFEQDTPGDIKTNIE